MNQDKDIKILALMRELNLPTKTGDKNTYDIIEKFYNEVFDAGKFEGIMDNEELNRVRQK